MKRAFLIGSAFVAMMATAHATDWWLMDAGNGECVNAMANAKQRHLLILSSPGAFQNALRNEGTFSTLKVTRDDAGSIMIVRVVDTRGTVMLYAATRDACNEVLQHFVDAGALAPMRDLY